MIGSGAAGMAAGVLVRAFVLLELDGADMRREPIEVRKAPHRGAAK
jgi:hypothetical protein